MCHPQKSDMETILWEGVHPGSRGGARQSSAYGVKESTRSWSYWSLSLPWNSNAAQTDTPKRGRPYRLVILKQEYDDMWNVVGRDDVFRDGILPTAARVPQSAIAQIVQVRKMSVSDAFMNCGTTALRTGRR